MSKEQRKFKTQKRDGKRTPKEGKLKKSIRPRDVTREDFDPYQLE
jgi:hypothetical protein